MKHSKNNNIKNNNKKSKQTRTAYALVIWNISSSIYHLHQCACMRYFKPQNNKNVDTMKFVVTESQSLEFWLEFNIDSNISVGRCEQHASIGSLNGLTLNILLIVLLCPKYYISLREWTTMSVHWLRWTRVCLRFTKCWFIEGFWRLVRATFFRS